MEARKGSPNGSGNGPIGWGRITTNPTDFYTKLFPKMIQRSTQVDVSGTVTIDDAISRLESQPIEGHYADVSDASFDPLPFDL